MTGDSGQTRRIALLTEFDGSHFRGWQWQTKGRTVQRTLQETLARIVKHPVTLIGCSRTDAGVHAAGHVSHCRISATIPTDRIHLAMNALLPDDLAVLQAFDVPDDFNARFDARAKTYRYRVWNGTIRPVLSRMAVSHDPRDLDLDTMRAAATHLIGTHDFSAFMAAGGTTKTTVRTIMDIEVKKETGQPVYSFSFTGNGFLYNMVRILAGTLVYAGLGKIDPAAIPSIIAGQDRTRAGKTMPASGLTLEAVYYDLDNECKTISGIVMPAYRHRVHVH